MPCPFRRRGQRPAAHAHRVPSGAALVRAVFRRRVQDPASCSPGRRPDGCLRGTPPASLSAHVLSRVRAAAVFCRGDEFMTDRIESAGAVAVEWAPHRTLYARTLAEHVECARPCDTDMWRYRIFLRSFWLRWADTPTEERFGLVAEEPASLGERWDAFIAGYAQELCCRYRINPPGWVFRPEKYLDHFWFPTLEVQSDHTLLRIVTSPAPWLQEHGVLLWDRELATAQELIEGKGFTVHWRGDNMESFTRPTIIEAFEDAAGRIRYRHVKAVVYLVGGAAAAMAYDATRTTMDADRQNRIRARCGSECHSRHSARTRMAVVLDERTIGVFHSTRRGLRL